jgi:hypothetical protein
MHDDVLLQHWATDRAPDEFFTTFDLTPVIDRSSSGQVQEQEVDGV